MKVLLIGTIPPPIGGISIHIERFLKTNVANKDFEIGIFDVRKRKHYNGNLRKSNSIFFIEFLKANIIHIHISNFSKIFFALLSRVFAKKVIYTHHSVRITNYTLFRTLAFLCDKVILVNDRDLKLIPTREKNKFNIIPAFIPPIGNDKLSDDIIQELNKYDYIISANCFKNVLYNGEQLYGFDTLIKAFNALSISNKIKDSLLVLVDPSNTMQDVVNKLKVNFEDNNNRILLINKPIDFSSLIQRSSVVVRPTRLDADALTVREALHFNIPVIASDCSFRPKGTIIFKTGDIQSLSNKINLVYSTDVGKENHPNENFNQKILNIYRNLI